MSKEPEVESKEDPFSDKAYERSVREAYDQVHNEEGTDSDEDSDLGVDAPSDDSGVSEELEGTESKDEEEPKEEVEAKKEEPKKLGRPKKRQEVNVEVVPAPSDWSAEGKEKFKGFPPAAQKEISRIANQYAQHRHQDYQKLQGSLKQIEAKEREISHLTQAVRPFAEQWAKRGVTEAAGILQCVSIAKALQENPVETCTQYLNSLGYKVEVPNYQNKGVANNQGLTQAQVEQLVEQRYSQESQKRQFQETQTRNHSVLTQACSELIEETNPSGQYIYRDLHDPEVVQRMNRCFKGIIEAYPSASPKELVVMTYRAAGGKVAPQNTPTLIKNKQNNVQAARRALGSIRSSAQAPEEDSLEYVPNESHEDTARRAYYATMNRR